MMNVCITYCSWQKDDRLKDTGGKVPPEQLYLSGRIQRFIAYCREQGLQWGIFSDLYGIIFENDKQAWYDFHPDLVSPAHRHYLAKAFAASLSEFKTIWYYYDPETINPLYRQIVEESGIADKVVWVTELERMEKD